MELTDEEKQMIANGMSLAEVLALREQPQAVPSDESESFVSKSDNAPTFVQILKNSNTPIGRYTEQILNTASQESNPNPENMNQDIDTEEKESIWSKIAKMLPSIKMGQNSGTTMAGWTRYNGGSSPIAAAYNNWLANRQNAQNSLRATLINAETQKELAAKNAESTNKSISDQTDKENKVKLQNSFTQDVTPIVAEMRQNEHDLKSAEAEAQSLINPKTGNVDETNKIAYNKLLYQISVLKNRLSDNAAELDDLEESYGLHLTTGQSALKGRYITKEGKTEDKPVVSNVTPTATSVPETNSETNSETDGETGNSSLNILKDFKYSAGKDIKSSKDTIEQIESLQKLLSDESVKGSLSPAVIENYGNKLKADLAAEKKNLKSLQIIAYNTKYNNAVVKLNKGTTFQGEPYSNGFNKWKQENNKPNATFVDFLIANGATKDEIIDGVK